MLAVAVSPHGFTAALASEASIVPRASHREITLAACLGRVLGAEPQVGCCWSNSHSYSYSFVSHPPLRTVRDRFRVTRLCGGGLASVQPLHITCASPWKVVHLDRFALYVAFPRSLVGYHSHDYYRSSVAIFLSEGRRSRVSSRWYVRATDVGHPLISLLDLIGHRLQ